MKKGIVVTLGVFIVTILLLTIIPATRDEIYWRWVVHKDDAESYLSYVRSWPAGRHTAEAWKRYDDLSWAGATAANTLWTISSYIENSPVGGHIKEAKARYDDLLWADANSTNTLQGFEHYLRLESHGKHVREARNRIEAHELKHALAEDSPSLLRDFVQKYKKDSLAETAHQKLAELEDSIWEAARKENRVDLYKSYLRNYPNGSHIKDANARKLILEFDSGFGFHEPFTKEQFNSYMKALKGEVYSTSVKKPLVFYDVGYAGECVSTTNKWTIPPSHHKKAVSLHLEANNLSVTAVYISFPSNSLMYRALFPVKWQPDIVHNGCDGPGLEIDLNAFRQEEFGKFLDTFSIVHNVLHSAVEDMQDGYVIPDLLWGANETGFPYPNRGRVFNLKRQDRKIVFKVDGMKGMPDTVIKNYNQALALKTYLKIRLNK